MKIIFSLLFSISILNLFAQEEPTAKEIQQGTEQLGKQVNSLMNYFQKYEKKTSQEEKKQAYEKAVDDMDTEGEATQKERDDAFKIIDAYIKADQAPAKPQKKQIALKDQPQIKKQAQDIFDEAKNRLMAMSYEEYESYIWKTNPMATRREVKESFNQLHKDDAKHVQITALDDKPTKTQTQILALQKMENAKTYTEYRDAIKTINPNLSDKDIKNAWKNR
jgi:ribosomal protein L23